MQNIKNLFLDLDGTLTDPKEGITKSIQHALRKMSVEPPSMDDLEWCIGPPLTDAFEKLLNSKNNNDIQRAIEFYRERYEGTCMHENKMYEGIHNTLDVLSNAGFDLYLATSKPWVYAGKILEHFELHPYFTAIHGSELDGTRDYKHDLIAYILDHHKLDFAQTVMIGDRHHDINGAKQNQVFSVGVTYGFGSEKELLDAGADKICHHHSDIVDLMCPKKT